MLLELLNRLYAIPLARHIRLHNVDSEMGRRAFEGHKRAVAKIMWTVVVSVYLREVHERQCLW